MNLNSRLGISPILAAMGALFGMLLFSCNTNPETEERLSIRLPDSLSSDQGPYDRLQINLLNAAGDTLQPLLYDGPFHYEETGGTIRDLLLLAPLPPSYQIEIMAFQGDITRKYAIVVVDGAPGALIVISDPLTPDDTSGSQRPTGIVLSDTAITLGISGSPRRIFYSLIPSSATGDIAFTSLDEGIAAVDAEGNISPVQVGSTYVFASVNGFPALRDSVKVTVISPPAIHAVTFTRPAPILYVGGPSATLSASHSPDSLILIPEFHSNDESVITVSALGEVMAVSAGKAIITIAPAGIDGVQDTLIVKAVRDAPVLDAGVDQSVAVGETVTFQVAAAQEYGTLELSWDFTGDDVPEGISTQSPAAASHTYSAEGDFQVVFTAKDGEGNTTILTRRVRVGKAGPLILITSPKNDTLINTNAITIQYTSDGTPASQDFPALKEGENTLVVRASNASGEDSVEVKVTVDTKAPVVKITAPANGLQTRETSVAVKWTVDQGPEQSGTETLAGNDGEKVIIRSVTDAAGNTGSDTIRVVLDRMGPGAPLFTTTHIVTPSANPELSWASAGGGSGHYRIRQGQAGTWMDLGQVTEYTPETLSEGTHSFFLQERDLAMNWSPNSRPCTVTVDLSAPTLNITSLDKQEVTAPAFVLMGNAGDALSGIKSLVVTRTQSPALSGNPTLSGVDWSMPVTLVEGDNAFAVTATDQVDRASTKTVTIRLNSPKPNPPQVESAQTGLINNGITNNRGFKWTSGGGGNGVFRIRLNSETNYRESNNTSRSWSVPTNVADGTHTVRVSESSAAGKWSDEGTFTIQLDTKGPTIVIKTRNELVTSEPVIPIQYSLDGVDQLPENCTLDASKTSTQCSITKSDNVGNATTQSITVYYRPNVTFFKPDGLLSGDGKSWETARSFRGDLTGLSGELWVQAGSYEMPLDVDLRLADVKVFGGVTANAKSSAEVSGVTTITGAQFETIHIDNVEISNFKFTGVFGEAAITIQNQSENTLRNCEFVGLLPTIPYVGVGVNVAGGTATFVDCIFNNIGSNGDMISDNTEHGIIKFRNYTFISHEGQNFDIYTVNPEEQTIKFDGINKNGVTPRIYNMDAVCGLGGTTLGCASF